MARLRDSEIDIDEAVIVVIMNSLRRDFSTIPGALARWDFVRACRDHEFVITNPESREILLKKDLIESFDESGRAVIHDAIRSITIAGTSGEGLDLRFRDPIA